MPDICLLTIRDIFEIFLSLCLIYNWHFLVPKISLFNFYIKKFETTKIWVKQIWDLTCPDLAYSDWYWLALQIHLKTIHTIRRFHRYPSDTIQTPSRHLLDTIKTPVLTCPYLTCPDFTYPNLTSPDTSYTIRESQRYPPDTIQTPLRHPLNTLKTPARHPQKISSM